MFHKVLRTTTNHFHKQHYVICFLTALSETGIELLSSVKCHLC
jgi:hypothetical protein